MNQSTKEVLFIPPMWGGSWVFDKFRILFEEAGMKVRCFEYPYHNLKDMHDEPDPELGKLGLLDYAKMIGDFIKDNYESPPIIIGFSMGGLLAQIVVSRGYAKAEKIIAITPSPCAGVWALHPATMKAFWSIMKRWGFWRKPMRQTYEEAIGSMLNLLSVDERTDIFSQLQYESGRAAFQIGYYFLDPLKSSWVDESKIDCPLLIIGAGKDQMTPISVTRRIAKKFKKVFGFQYVEFPENAHWPIGEPGYEEVARACIEFIKRKKGDREL